MDSSSKMLLGSTSASSALDQVVLSDHLNFLSYGLLTAVNNLWPFVAVLTAAASFFWSTARSALSSSSSSSPPVPQRADHHVSSSSQSETNDEHVDESNDQQSVSAKSNTTTTTYSCALELQGESAGVISKVKFSTYYYNEDDGGDNNNNNGDLVNDQANGTAGCCTGDNCHDHESCYKDDDQVMDENLEEEFHVYGAVNWEKYYMDLRMRDMGWYRYQDLSVLDGNVVRLWDTCSWRRRHTTPALVAEGSGGAW